MKKSLLALAVLGAFAASAQAQTSVTIGGIVQANVVSYKVGNTTRAVSNETRVDDSYTSRFWLKGEEDLGGSNKAFFYIENRLNTTDSSAVGVGNGLGNGDTHLGLKGSWGQFAIGKFSWMSVQGLATEALTGSNNVQSAPTSAWATYSILNQSAGYLDVGRRNNALQYKLPGGLGGFNGMFGVSTNSAGNEGTTATTNTCVGAGGSVITLISATAANCTAAGGALVATTPTNQYSDGSEYFVQVGYANGPFFANLNYRDFSVEGRTGRDETQTRLQAFYKFPFGLKVGAMIDRAKSDSVTAGNTTASASRTAWALPVSYGFGANTISATYAKAGDRGGVADTGAKFFTVGYDYALSKRTNVGAYYNKLRNESAAAYQPFLAGTSATGTGLAAGESATTFGVGVKHSF